MNPNAKDPVCGISVDKASIFSTEHDGKTYYFCSDKCMKAFQFAALEGGLLELPER